MPEELFKQVPALAVLAFLVIVFLRHLAKRDEVLRTIGNDCHEVQRESIAAINQNTKMLGKITITLDKMNGHSGKSV